LGSPSQVRSAVEKTKENNRKIWKINRIVNQTFVLKLEHDKNLSVMGFKYHVGEHAEKGMMV
jgi:hypothetical protein